jgi:hypothetical protein
MGHTIHTSQPAAARRGTLLSCPQLSLSTALTIHSMYSMYSMYTYKHTYSTQCTPHKT